VHLEKLNLHQTIIADSHISYCRRGGIRIEDSEIRNLQITGNDIEYNNYRAFQESFADADAEAEPTAEIYVDVVNGSVREGTISSNTIQATYSSNGANIRFIGAGPAPGGLFRGVSGTLSVSRAIARNPPPEEPAEGGLFRDVSRSLGKSRAIARHPPPEELSSLEQEQPANFNERSTGAQTVA
jgi:hypothetical protein